MRVFLDANLLFSAAYRSDASLLALLKMSKVELVSSEYAIAEAERNLSEAVQRERLAALTSTLRVVRELAPMPPGVELAAKDCPILQAAIRAGCSHLLTGDKRDFGRLFGLRPGGVLVQLPRDFIAEHGR